MGKKLSRELMFVYDKARWVREQRPWVYKLFELGACPQALFYLERCKSFASAWRACSRPDWMYWILLKRLGNLKGYHHTDRLLKMATAFHQRFGYYPISRSVTEDQWTLSQRRNACRFIRTMYPTVAPPRRLK